MKELVPSARVGHKKNGCPYVIQSPEKPIEIQQ